MKEFMLIFKGKHQDWNNKSEKDWQELMAKHELWAKKLSGKWAGTKLASKPSKVLSEKNGAALVTDGPFAETKEVITGYYTIMAENMDHAVELGKGCPWLLHDRMEIFQTEDPN